MSKVIVQECPCGYLFRQRIEIEKQTIPASNMITCKPGLGSVIDENPRTIDRIVKKEILNGDEAFKNIFVLVDYYHRIQECKRMQLLICPKCGTVLLPAIAMGVKEEE